MILDLFSDLNINFKAIDILGLNGAAYMSLLLSIYNKAFSKNKVDQDGYFKIDRKYVTNKLTLLQEEQLACDLNLTKLGIMAKKNDDPDSIKIDISLYLSLITSDDLKLMEDVKKQMKVKKPKGIRQSQRQALINSLKDSIVCSNYELLTALREWVDGIFSKPNGFLSKTTIKVFQDTLNNYTQGDLDLALRLVQIATVQGYKDCTWAINVYEKDQKIKSKANIGVRTTNQKVADPNKLSDMVF